MKKFAFCLFIYLFWSPIQFVYAIYLNSNVCPQFYTCDITQSIFTIRCMAPCSPTVGANVLQLPDKSQVNALSSTLSIIGKSNLLQSLPTNLCTYGSALRILDLSSNAIKSTLTASFFDCLSVIETINLSNNFISSIEENAFNSLDSLITLDLSYNGLVTLPAKLFVLKLPFLQSLNLQNNMLIEIDVWFFFLKSINYINLANNRILKFKNSIGWTPRTTTTLTQLLGSQSTIDMSYNNLTKFDDDLLKEYGICSSGDLSYFLKLMYNVILTNNKFVCSCDSYNMLLFYQTLITNNAITTVENLFQSKCSSPVQYQGQSIFSFKNSDECVGISKYSPIVYETCIASVINSTLDFLVNPSALETSLDDQPVDRSLNGAQIAGIVIGAFALFFLLLVLLYCNFPIEILACIFDGCKCLYRICPCKANAYTNKYYDVFISYNKSSEKWIKNQLLPFFKREKPNSRYYLQHASDNPEKHGKFGSYTMDKMSNSSIILLVLSDTYLIKEWSNTRFQDHLRHLLTKPQKRESRHRVLGIQLHDVNDEEFDDYIESKLQIPHFVSLETDEWMFWKKLEYFLFLNRDEPESVMPLNLPPVSSADESTIIEEKGIVNEQFLLDEYTTSLEQIVYEKQPEEVVQNIKYDHLNKKFKIKVGGNQEEKVTSIKEYDEDHKRKEKRSRRSKHNHSISSKHNDQNSDEDDQNLNHRILNESLKYYRSINRTPRNKSANNEESFERTGSRSGSRSKSHKSNKSANNENSILKCSDPKNMVLF